MQMLGLWGGQDGLNQFWGMGVGGTSIKTDKKGSPQLTYNTGVCYRCIGPRFTQKSPTHLQRHPNSAALQISCI